MWSPEFKSPGVCWTINPFSQLNNSDVYRFIQHVFGALSPHKSYPHGGGHGRGLQFSLLWPSFSTHANCHFNTRPLKTKMKISKKDKETEKKSYSLKVSHKITWNFLLTSLQYLSTLLII